MNQSFDDLWQQLSSNVYVSSDECLFYKGGVKKYLPSANYNQFLGKKAYVAGQWELKKTSFESIFSINHTVAIMRATVIRVIRKTRNITKKIERFIDHLNMYVWMHNTH